MRNITEQGSAPLMGVASVLSFFTPIYMLIAIAVAFTFIDMILTALAVYEQRKRRRKVRISELGIKQGVYNVCLSAVIIALCWLLGTHVMQMPDLHLERIGAGFICVFELLVILKRATFLTKKKAYRNLDNFLKSKLNIQEVNNLKTK